MNRATHSIIVLVVCIGAIVYVFAVANIQHWRSNEGPDELRIALPGYLDVLFAAGDRHLAANIAVFRSMMVSAFNKDPETYRIQGKIQRQAAILNPYQEDNYYVAAAILPWEGQVSAAQFVLDRATSMRVWDWMPPFFEAFNAAYFNHNYIEAGRLAEIASERSKPPNSLMLRDIAAKWYSRQQQTHAAIATLSALKVASKDRRMKAQLQARIEQLKGLQILKDAAAAYEKAHGWPPARLQYLVSDGQLDHLPVDPLGQGYALDAMGQPVINHGQRSERKWSISVNKWDGSDERY